MGGAPDETINGLAGNDQLFGNGGNDILYGGDGNDQLQGNIGNDLLYGGNSGDTYIFKIGDGQDTLKEQDDSNTSTKDRLQFLDVLPTQITLKQKDLNLVVSYGNSDQISIVNYFTLSGNQIEEIVLSDGTIWGVGDIQEKYRTGTPGDDIITGDNSNNVLAGNAGNDTLDARSGQDSLEGGDGNDILLAGSGNDKLDGGRGNDSLEGSDGSDTYIFRKGDGADSVNNLDNGGVLIDRVQFIDILPTQIRSIKQFGMDLIIAYATSDQITIKDFFIGGGYGGYSAYRYDIEEIVFSDGTVWNGATIASKYLAGTVEGDILTGGAGIDMLNGYQGNDTLSGQEGNDVLTGGMGNDSLLGGTGNDTFNFSRGDGRDTIESQSLAANEVNTLQFGPGILATDIIAKADGDDLILSLSGTNDSVLISRFFYSGDTSGITKANPIQQIKFGDGTAWESLTYAAAVQFKTGTDVADGLTGTKVDDTISGGAGNDKIYGQAGNDALSGNEGNDVLVGGYGNDVLDGGPGNDQLDGGGEGKINAFVTDTYLFRSGDGTDVVGGMASNNIANIKFLDIASAQIRFMKQDGLDLIVAYGINDQITIKNFYMAGWYVLLSITFSDGEYWDDAKIKQVTGVL